MFAFEQDWRKINLSGKCKETGEELHTPAIVANEHGVKNGWFLFPIDFDPVWLEKCVFLKTQKPIVALRNLLGV